MRKGEVNTQELRDAVTAEIVGMWWEINNTEAGTNESVPLITEWAFEHTPDHDECVVCRVRNHNNKENN